MVKIKLKTVRKKTKRVKAFKKNKKNKTRKNKTRKNKKMTGGEDIDIDSCHGEACTKNDITEINTNDITEINTNDKETEFSQMNAIINYGVGPISTYNIVNCLSIGGIFKINEKFGTFLTHESPTDYLEQQKKLRIIEEILHKQNANITNIILFRVDKQSTSVYKDRLTTESIIKIMIDFLNKTFKLKPTVKYYSCDSSNMLCGKAIISPNEYNTTLEPFRLPDNKTTRPEAKIVPNGTFNVIVSYNKNGDKVHKCPNCKLESGTDFTSFMHAHDCPNKNKIPIE